MILIIPQQREPDAYGAGYFGAPRGSRTHNGVDYACAPGSVILSPVDGVVSKLGYPYSDDLSFKYVEVTTEDDMRVRLFYVEPSVTTGDQVYAATSVLGSSQKLGDRYGKDDRHASAITEHVHIEVKNADGGFIHPAGVLG